MFLCGGRHQFTLVWYLLGPNWATCMCCTSWRRMLARKAEQTSQQKAARATSFVVDSGDKHRTGKNADKKCRQTSQHKAARAISAVINSSDKHGTSKNADKKCRSNITACKAAPATSAIINSGGKHRTGKNADKKCRSNITACKAAPATSAIMGCNMGYNIIVRLVANVSGDGKYQHFG